MTNKPALEALGTRWWFEVLDLDTDKWWSEVQTLITTFEAEYTRFKSTSLIGRLNAGEVIHNPSSELVALLRYGKEAYLASNGAFNILTGAKQVRAGYGQVPLKPEEVEVADPVTDLQVGDEVRLMRGQIDLGGFGKGWLIDKVAAELRTLGSEHFLINGGGDIYATSDTKGEPFPVYVEHPAQESFVIADIPLHNQALAVSSSYKRSWQTAEGTVNHLHHTNVAAHVVADTALKADTLATTHCLGKAIENTDYGALLWKDNNFMVNDIFRPWLIQGEYSQQS
jgi:thiamine biosynthesis lipoprotein